MNFEIGTQGYKFNLQNITLCNEIKIYRDGMKINKQVIIPEKI